MGRCQNNNIHRNLEEVDSTPHGWLWADAVEIISEVKVAQLCLTFYDPKDYTVHGILQARILEWVAFPFSKGSSQPRGWTQVSRTAGRFFITREAQEYWSGWPIPSPADLPNPGIELGSPALQVDSLPSELWGKPKRTIIRNGVL